VEGESRYQPSSEQRALASTIDATLAELLPLSRLHSSSFEDAKTWSGLEEIGMFGISLSEERGGSGLGAAEEALIVMGLGRRLAAPAILATIGATHAPLANMDKLREGRVAAAYRSGERIIVVGEPDVDFVLLRDRDGAALYKSSPQAANDGDERVDNRLWLAELRAPTNLGELVARYEPSQLLRLRLIDAAALAGISEAALDMSVAYAGMREQFGRPIGAFQAVKHHCANMAIATRCARDQTSFAAVAVDEDRTDAALQVESALFMAGSAALETASKNIQIHGGIGFSDEADPHLFLKRAQLLIAIAGGLEAANERIANAKTGW
jgi:alkylation response protein AidB-like acyl-CoA dehydrogenase